MNRAYNHYFFHYTQTPLLVVNTSEVDFVKRRGGRGRPPEADPAAWEGHAVLRAAGKQEVAGLQTINSRINSAPPSRSCGSNGDG